MARAFNSLLELSGVSMMLPVTDGQGIRR